MKKLLSIGLLCLCSALLGCETQSSVSTTSPGAVSECQSTGSCQMREDCKGECTEPCGGKENRQCAPDCRMPCCADKNQ